MQFHFGDKPNPSFPNFIIFVKSACIFTLNFQTEAVNIIYSFSREFDNQPLIFVPNSDNTIFFVASSKQGRIVNIKTLDEFSFDLNFDLENFKQVVYDEEKKNFFVLANRYEEKLGLFLIVFNEKSPQDFKFLIKWNLRLDIGDSDMYILRCADKGYKELIVSYKIIYLNIYNVL